MSALTLAGLAALAFPVSAGSANPVAEARQEQSGRLVIVGGGLQPDNEAIYRTVLEGRHGDGPMCIIPTASDSPESEMESAMEHFASLIGAENVEGILVTVDNPSVANDPVTAERIRRCSGFWFTGGAQYRVVETFRPGGAATEGYRALMKRMAEGAVIAGTSAGAAMMSDPMIRSGGSAEAFLHGVRDSDEEDGVWITTGMGFFPGAFVDQHFLARGRVGRLLVASVSGAGPSVGFGIDENTALVVDRGWAEVVGASGVLVVDARGATPGAALPAARTIRIHLAGAGDVIDLQSLDVTPGAGKTALPRGGRVTIPENPFERWAFLHLLADFASAPEDEVVLTAPGHSLRLRKAEGFAARCNGAKGVEGAPGGLSAGLFLMDIVPAWLNPPGGDPQTVAVKPAEVAQPSDSGAANPTTVPRSARTNTSSIP